MENFILHTSDSRGLANHGWLNSRHTFCFANYYNPQRMNFGALRVLNDDRVAGGMGFGTHPHDNMEIVSIPLHGALRHRDNMGNEAIIRKGDIQVMSAGTGVSHSEQNNSSSEEVKFLQIWILPNKRNVTPRYDQYHFAAEQQQNELLEILSPTPKKTGVWIHQEAWFSVGRFDTNAQTQYALNAKQNGVYAFVLAGSFEINGHLLHSRDGLGLWDVSELNLTARSENAEILLMEVPLAL